MTLRTGLLVTAAALALAACDEDMEMTEMEDGTGAGIAENACVTAVNANMTRGGSTVISSNFTEAGTLVMLRSRDGTNWRCIASDNGVVADLSVV